MSPPPPSLQDPYRALIQQLNRNGVRYVVIGMAGINYYAKNPAETFATLDYDLFLEPSVKNVTQAFRTLTVRGFSLGTSAGLVKTEELPAIVRERRTLIATTPEGLSVELLLKVSGYSFWELAKDTATFTVRGVPVKVGRLHKLLRSKQLANRPKDSDFLRRYQRLLEQERASSLPAFNQVHSP